jgi:hypothetical protein
MDLLKRLSSLFSSPAATDSSAYWVTARCRRCGEIIRTRVDLRNDLSAEYDDGGVTYICHKTLMGEGHCFQRIEVELTFDGSYHVLNREITGGEFVDETKSAA